MSSKLKYINYLKHTVILGSFSGVLWFGYQVYETHRILNNTLDTSIINYFDPTPKRYVISSNKYICTPKQPQKSHSFIDRFWDEITFVYARRLISIAQSDDRYIRSRAVKGLASIKNLDDWHYSLLSHMLDPRTAIGLARSKEADLKYFLNAPNKYIDYTNDKLVKWMKHFLIQLASKTDHPCMSYFIKKAFVNIQEVGRMVEHDISSAELAKCIQCADEILPNCIQSVLHHSTIDNNAKDLVLHNGLPLLMEVYKRYKNNPEVVICLVKIIANVSIYPEYSQDLYKSGWIGILALLLRNDDIRIHGPAAKALANLDIDNEYEYKYERKMYLLHPMYRTEESADVDIILIHGLLGGVFFTWRQRNPNNQVMSILGKKKKSESITNDEPVDEFARSSDPSTREFFKEIEERKKVEWDEIGKDFEIVFQDCPLCLNEAGPYSCTGELICGINDGPTQCWPKDWLPKDCSKLRIIGVNYDTSLSLWAPACPKQKTKATLEERSQDFLEKLHRAGIGKKPIIWLTHSMGGLITKKILLKALDSNNEELQDICRNTKGIVFFSTPHRGTHVASLNNTTALLLWPSVEVRELRAGSPALLQLNDNFLNLLKKVDIKVISFVETESTIISPLKLNFHFVQEKSAWLNIGEYYEVPLDHMRICKPVSRHSFLYQKVLNFIETVAKEHDKQRKL